MVRSLRGRGNTDMATSARDLDWVTFGFSNDRAYADLLAVERPQEVYQAVAARTPTLRHDGSGGSFYPETHGVTLFRMDDILFVNRRRDVLGHGGRGPTCGANRPLVPLEVDGPQHTKIRKLLDPVFSPKRVAEWEPVVHAEASALIDTFAGRGKVELFSEFCEPLPSRIFLRIMGLPRADLPAFLAFKNGVLRPEGATLEARQAFAAAAGRTLYDYMYPVVDDRAARPPTGDLISSLAHAEVDGERLNRDEVVDILFVLMFAGLDTVSASLSCIVNWLARHPDHRHRLTAEPDILPAAIEEIMRFESPVHTGRRYATVDFELPSGEVVKAGEPMLVQWAAANLDPKFFPEPLTVDFDRPANRHIVFASGFHRCLGSHLARMELRVALGELHRRIPDYGIDPDDKVHYEHIAVRTVGHLPLVF
jgi:cytochrome P450